MSTWGIPYQGSKNSIAEDIIRYLPKGNRFVDLFGGGFAISHCALVSNKWNYVLYNDYSEQLTKLIIDAISGKFDYSVFKPEFITREEFHEKKHTNAYIKYVWSFSNSGKEYLFGKDLEPRKQSIHNWVVFGIKDEWFDKYFYDVDRYIKTDNIKGRRLLWKKYIEIIKKDKTDKNRVQQLERLERLANLQQLQQLERLANLQFTYGDYREYNHLDGDIVYCDPPYEGTATYDGAGFNHKEFYDWVASREYVVYFSSYRISDKRFEMVWAENKRSLMSGASENYNYECIYSNRNLLTENNL